ENQQQIRLTTEQEKRLEEQLKRNDEARQKGMETIDKQFAADMEATQKAQDFWQKQNAEGRAATMKGLDEELMVNMEADQKVAAEGKKAAEEYTRAWLRARDQMASSIDTFFREITSGGIGKAFLAQFEKLASQ